jgi:hypothetical protein
LSSGTAHFWYEWRWVGRNKLTLSLGVREPKEGSTINETATRTIYIRYYDGRFKSTGRRGAKAPSNPGPKAEIEGL